MTQVTNPRVVDPRPLMEAALERSSKATVVSTCAEFGMCPRTWHRWAANSTKITVYVADKYACRIGLHPAEIWGDDWWTF